MKKILVYILSLTMMLFLTACGSTEGTSSAAQKATTAEKNAPTSAKVDSVTQNADEKNRKKFW